jgi:hypothetical protein
LIFASPFKAWLAKPFFAVDNAFSTFVAERWSLLFAEFALRLVEADHFKAFIARIRRAFLTQTLHE